ncbi:MAG TPA: sigma-70 region 4 domain-containing protein [Rhizomicrobium sp.]|jgi:DNA-directed RNA polymerase specialized sigma24 family protein|nr:sigma-70 region 4 domain-containing protein [Rhizomicrobium sp.]
MDTRTLPSHFPPQTKKREQKFARFDFLPGDEDLIAQLPPEQQAALRAQGSYAQRAQEMGIAVGTVRSRLHRARAALVRLRAQGAPGTDPLH